MSRVLLALLSWLPKSLCSWRLTVRSLRFLTPPPSYVCVRTWTVQAKGSREEAEALVGMEVLKSLAFALKVSI